MSMSFNCCSHVKDLFEKKNKKNPPIFCSEVNQFVIEKDSILKRTSNSVKTIYISF